MVVEETIASGMAGRPEWFSPWVWARITGGMSSSKGRYKPKFHWCERIAQLCCTDPDLPSKTWERIFNTATDGAYGPPTKFTRTTVIKILNDLGLQQYRERWKKILVMLNPTYKTTVPTPEFIERVGRIYDTVESRFFEMKHTMPKSVIRKPNGVVKVQDRHSNLPFNYLFVKICEALDVREWHHELPLLRSPAKLHSLDDVTKEIFGMLGLKFRRTVVMKLPKKRTRRVKPIAPKIKTESQHE